MSMLKNIARYVIMDTFSFLSCLTSLIYCISFYFIGIVYITFQLKTIVFPKVCIAMKPKNGFLLIELMVGLSLSTFFLVLIAHYIIEVKVTQQKALQRIESFSLARNKKEKALAKKNVDMYV